MNRKYSFKKSLLNTGILLILISVCICPKSLYAQGDIEVERSQNVQTWIDNYSKTYNIAKPALEVIREEHKDFYGEFGDALTALDIYIKLSNAQDWQAFETALLAAEGKMLGYFVSKGMLSSTFTTSLAIFAAAKTAMELFKTYVFDPYLMNDAVDRYYGMREIGNEPADAIAIIGAIGNIRPQLLDEFRKIHGDQVFEEIAPSGLNLQDRWEPRFQEFALAFFENAYAQRKFEEMKKEAEKKRQELESEIPALEAQMRAILDDLLDRTETLSITPSGETTLEMGETIQFTVTATTYGGEEKDVTDEAMLESTFVAESPGAHSFTAIYDEHTVYATVIVNESSDEQDTQCNEPSEVLYEETGSCGCNTAEGYEMNDELGKCINIDEALDEVTEEEDALCDEDALAEKLARLEEIAASGNRLAADFQTMLNKFMKEINDQNIDQCTNNSIAYTYAGARETLAEYQVMADQVTGLGTDLMLEGAICPLEELELDVNRILQNVSQVGQPLGRMEEGLAEMDFALSMYGCDDQEVSDRGDIIADRSTNPEVIESGGVGTFNDGAVSPNPGTPGGGVGKGISGGIGATYMVTGLLPSINVMVNFNFRSFNFTLGRSDREFQRFENEPIQEGERVQINVPEPGLNATITLIESDFFIDPGYGERVFAMNILVFFNNERGYAMSVTLGGSGLESERCLVFPGGGRCSDY